MMSEFECMQRMRAALARASVCTDEGARAGFDACAAGWRALSELANVQEDLARHLDCPTAH
jgi:hypothetical protein